MASLSFKESHIIGVINPLLAILNKFFIAGSFNFGYFLKYSPALTPSIDIPFIRAILTGREGIVPLANPITNNLPPHLITFKDFKKFSPPIGS